MSYIDVLAAEAHDHAMTRPPGAGLGVLFPVRYYSVPSSLFSRPRGLVWSPSCSLSPVFSLPFGGESRREKSIVVYPKKNVASPFPPFFSPSHFLPLSPNNLYTFPIQNHHSD